MSFIYDQYTKLLVGMVPNTFSFIYYKLMFKVPPSVVGGAGGGGGPLPSLLVPPSCCCPSGVGSFSSFLGCSCSSCAVKSARKNILALRKE